MNSKVNKEALKASKECKEKALNRQQIVVKNEDKASRVPEKK